MKTKITISIVLPTYNAGKHLIHTLNSVKNQTKSNLIIEVLIAIDGGKLSEEIRKNIKFSKVKYLIYKDRQGQSQQINNLLKKAKGNLIIMINDDVVLVPNAITKVYEQYKKTLADLICAQVEPLSSKSLLEKILYTNTNIRNTVINKFYRNDHYLCCNGRFLAFSKKLAKKIIIPKKLWNNDAFIYLYAKINNYKFSYIQNTLCYYRDPKTLREYFSQTNKFNNSLKENSIYLKKIDKYYYIPPLFVIHALLIELLRKPIMTLSYFLINLLSRVNAVINLIEFEQKNQFWETDFSTKDI